MIIGSKLLPIIMSKSGGGASRFILPIFKKTGGGGGTCPPVPYTPGAHASRSTALGAWCRSTGANPSLLLCNSRPVCCWSHSWCVPYYMYVRSPRHLTSHLFHSYISTTHSLRSQLCIISFCVSRSLQATSLGSKTTRQSSISSYMSRIRTETMECAIGRASRAMALPNFKVVGPAIHLALPNFF